MWKDLGKTLALSVVVALVVRTMFSDLVWHPFWILAASSSLFFAVMFFIACKIHLVRPSEADHVYGLVRKTLAKVRLVKNVEVARD